MELIKRRPLLTAAVVAAVVLGPLLWWLLSPLFLSQEVDEAFPFDLPDETAAAAMAPEEIERAVNEAMAEIEATDALEEMSAEEMEAVEERLMALAAAMPAHEMAEEMPAAPAEWQVVGQGQFRDADSFHRGAGRATIYQQGNDRVLRLEDFTVTNGPDLHVLLVDNPDITAREGMGDYLDLGSLKGNTGNQNYEIPADADLSLYGGVMIYCMPFHVVFSTAPLSAP